MYAKSAASSLNLSLLVAVLLCGCASPEGLPANQATGRPVTSFPAGLEDTCRAHLAELRSANVGDGDIFDPTDPATIADDFEPPVGVYVYNPDFPRDALERGLRGAVAVGGIIEIDGTISNAKLLQASPAASMDRAALEAFQQRRYQVARLNGLPVRTYNCAQTTFDFR